MQQYRVAPKERWRMLWHREEPRDLKKDGVGREREKNSVIKRDWAGRQEKYKENEGTEELGGSKDVATREMHFFCTMGKVYPHVSKRLLPVKCIHAAEEW